MLRALSLAIYGIIGFGTYGHTYNHGCGVITKHYEDKAGGGATFTTYESCAIPVVAGAFWPFYLAGNLAIEVTK